MTIQELIAIAYRRVATPEILAAEQAERDAAQERGEHVVKPVPEKPWDLRRAEVGEPCDGALIMQLVNALSSAKNSVKRSPAGYGYIEVDQAKSHGGSPKLALAYRETQKHPQYATMFKKIFSSSKGMLQTDQVRDIAVALLEDGWHR